MWALVIVLLVVLLLPYLLVPLYRFVNPVSTLMLWRWATGARVERYSCRSIAWRRPCRSP